MESLGGIQVSDDGLRVLFWPFCCDRRPGQQAGSLRPAVCRTLPRTRTAPHTPYAARSDLSSASDIAHIWPCLFLKILSFIQQ